MSSEYRNELVLVEIVYLCVSQIKDFVFFCSIKIYSLFCQQKKKRNTLRDYSPLNGNTKTFGKKSSRAQKMRSNFCFNHRFVAKYFNLKLNLNVFFFFFIECLFTLSIRLRIIQCGSH